MTQITKETDKKPTQALTTKDLFSREDVQKRFREMLGKKAQGFITSVLQIVTANNELSHADPMSIYNCAAMAATLDLPLNNNLGFAYIIPYKSKQPDGTYKKVAQFQIGYKGFIQLGQRSGQYQTIAAAPIYEGQLTECNPLTGFTFDFSKKTSDTVIGFAGYFRLLNGFEKTLYMTVDEMKAHGLRFSKTYKNGLWQTDFIGMGSKTVIKLLISKFGPMSIEMQKAVITDQALINDAETTDVTYIDHEPDIIDKEAERVTLMIEDAKTVQELEALGGQVVMSPEQTDLFNAKKEELNERK